MDATTTTYPNWQANIRNAQRAWREKLASEDAAAERAAAERVAKQDAQDEALLRKLLPFLGIEAEPKGSTVDLGDFKLNLAFCRESTIVRYRKDDPAHGKPGLNFQLFVVHKALNALYDSDNSYWIDARSVDDIGDEIAIDGDWTSVRARLADVLDELEEGYQRTLKNLEARKQYEEVRQEKLIVPSQKPRGLILRIVEALESLAAAADWYRQINM